MEERERLFEIILKAKQGDKEAIEEIIRRFEPLIMGSVKGVDEEIKEELKQDLIEIIIRAVKNFEIK
ncbi:Helix-turn-helix domain-containing protein [Thermoanaerobacter thermohydrosulfuricus]|uniref:Helix-turn-helix domain-containing protein n=1 Tax=Thermoanaerobacter thermohydrosulfuricus TaxID=1516 RepID=A0A1G7RP71_THETY|nr:MULTISPECIES: helix-turn-helix domain-containing protein [Thermoanaerobacter]SDG12587.1 Helix-turn-helix domain-containing protein [Thermoanaerobacter thermohydrosulfuricus]HHY80050.1 helix-turn-helix domain-containing protein [Thermoanaerobacter sp.]